uniref:Uncharacterized protein n=1 Tax=Picea glauca TaxID=3330 RepID=A0A101LWG4_PICGL|nr:hypothetical protein ABT39_MTgene1524 [Picea glauca]
MLLVLLLSQPMPLPIVVLIKRVLQRLNLDQELLLDVELLLLLSIDQGLELLRL